jgi:aminomethyltransferase
MNVERFKYNTNEVICSRSGYTGEDGFEIYMDNMTARMFWNGAITDEEIKIAPCGLGSRDILRLEMGYSLYGVDIDTATNPAAANLAWAVKETRKDFIGKDAIYSALQRGVPRKKIGFVMQEKSFPRYGYPVFSSAGKEIGVVRSGLYSPNLDKFIGTAYVDVGFTQNGAPLQIEIRDKKYSARVEKFPLIKPKVKRKELR